MWKRTFTVLIVFVAFALGAAAAALLLRSAWKPGSKDKFSSDTAMVQPTAAHDHQDLWTCGMHPQVIQDHPGTCPICHMRLTPLKSDGTSNSGEAKEKKVAYWWDPMLGPSSIADKPGKSAMGMDRVPVYEADLSAGPKVTIDPTVVQNMGVRTAEVTRGPLDVTVRAVGILKAPEPEMHDVTLKVSGFIEKLYANTEGVHVQAGDVLFDLYSPDLQVGEQELITAVRSLKAMDAAAGEPVRHEAMGLVESARRKLLLWGVAEQDVEAISRADQPPRTLPFRSPAAGAIVEKMVVQGSAVQAGVKVMRIEGHDKLWLDAEVYEDEIPAVSLGQGVESTVSGVPGKTFTGKVTFIYPHVDHMTRTETVRTMLDNPDMTMKPGMYASVRLVGRPVNDAVLAPNESVIDTGTRQIAFVVESEGRYDPRNVKVGLAGDDDKLQILEGLAPGDRVVTSGQFLMDVESRTTEAIQKLRKGPAAPSAEPKAEDMKNMVAMAEPASKPSTMPTTMTSTAPVTSQPLTVANCPMKKADWLQAGPELGNPYFGTSMSTCGDVKRKIAGPIPGSRLEPVTSAYLAVQRELNTDRLSPDSMATLQKGVDVLPAENYRKLKDATAKLTASKDLAAARAAFKDESSGLIAALEQTK